MKRLIAASILAIGSVFGSVSAQAQEYGYGSSLRMDSDFNFAIDSRTNCRALPDVDSRVVIQFSPGHVGVDYMQTVDGVVWGYEVYNKCWIRGDLLRWLHLGRDTLASNPHGEGHYQERPSSSVSYSVPQSRPRVGVCNVPSDIDSRGRRCGRRAASVRNGGR